MPDMTNADLAEAYADLRQRCLDLARSLSDEQANRKTQCCPEWSVKDTIAHLGGITADILSGNTADAATEPWADAQVESRRSQSLEDVCAEWEQNAAPIDEVLQAIGSKMLPQFYIDAWTHEWDIRQATGIGAEPDMRLIDFAWPMLTGAIEEKNGGALAVEVDQFELARLSMGRRSRRQIEALGLRPDGVVLWSPSPLDIIDAPRTAADAN